MLEFVLGWFVLLGLLDLLFDLIQLVLCLPFWLD